MESRGVQQEPGEILNEEIAASFFARVLEKARPFLSDEHFTVDGTLIEAWASQKSFRPKDGSGKPAGAGGEVDFKGEKPARTRPTNRPRIPMPGCGRSPEEARRS